MASNRSLRLGVFVLAGIVAALTAPTRAADIAPPPGSLSDAERAEVKRWVDLGVADVRRREAAEVFVAMQHFDAWPLVQKLLEDARTGADLDGQVWLDGVIARQRPCAEARLRRQTADLKHWEWNLRTALESYEKVGHNDPKWDDAARRGIRGFVANSTADRKLRAGLDEAVAAGCDDALILYFYARYKETDGMAPEALDPLYHRAADAMEVSGYPPDRKAYAALRYFNMLYAWETKKAREEQRRYDKDVWALLMRLTNSVWDKHWAAMSEQPDVPPHSRLEVAKMFFDAVASVPTDRQIVFDKFYPDLQRLIPNGPEPLLFKGHFYIGYAWDARGGGWANTVTPDGWKKMGERLAIARETLTKAYEMDPNRDEAAMEMLSVELGDGNGRDAMETWFKRAMKAHPDNKQACTSKMYYLQPKWHGSPQEMIAFGRECFETRNWQGDIPFMLVQAHVDVSELTEDPHAYLKQPEVWKDIARVYEPFVEGSPRSDWSRSRYAYYASITEHWDVAARQFKLLGDRAIPRQFGGQAPMEEMRKYAYEHATDAK